MKFPKFLVKGEYLAASYFDMIFPYIIVTFYLLRIENGLYEIDYFKAGLSVPRIVIFQGVSRFYCVV